MILQNAIVVWGGNAYINFRPTWKPHKTIKVYGSAAVPNGMKKFRLSQLAGKQVEGPGTPGCPVGEAERYEKKILLSTEDPPMVEVTLGIDKVFMEGGGCMPMANNRVNPGSVMGLGNVVTGGTVVTHPEPRTSPMPVWGAQLVFLVHQAGCSCGDRSRQRVPGGRLVDGVFVLNGEGEGGERHPVGQGKTAREPRTAEPGPKRSKLTPVNIPCGSPAGNLEIAGLQVGQGKDVFHDAQEAAGKMDVEAGVGTQ